MIYVTRAVKALLQRLAAIFFHILRIKISLIFFLLISHLHAQELVQNGSFESGITAWSPFGTGVTLALDSDAHTGSKSILVTTRTSVNAAIKQNVGPALNSLGSGAQITTRCWIKVAVASSVRLRLNLVASGGNYAHLLAEQQVRTANQWTQIEGTSVPTWTGTLATAHLYLEIGHEIEGLYSDCRLDDFSMQADADGDYLFDSEEASLQTNPNLADTEGDGMGDSWETRKGLNPLLNDADLDADTDGASNREEYFAATDPQAGSSQPGIPSDSDANQATRDLLRYFALLPSKTQNRVLLGHMMIAAAETAQEGYDHNILGLFNGTGKWPALLALPVEDVNAPLRMDLILPFALDYWNQGGLVLMKWAPFNPWTQTGTGDQTSVDMNLLLTPGDPGHETFVSWLDTIAVGLSTLQDAGVVVLWRPMSEMNGGWFWWGKRKRDEYIAVWRFIHDYFGNQKGLHNLIYVYESDSAVHDSLASDYYYPGDDWVDLIGHNLYSDTWDLPFESNQIFARYPKAYGFPQSGSDTQRDGSFDNLTYIQKIQEHYPRCCFMAPWPSNPSNSRYNAIIDNQHPQEFMDDPIILTREELDWQPGEELSIQGQSGAGDYCEGQRLDMEVQASGTGLSYQWYFENAAILNATQAQFSIVPVLASDAGNYYCEVADADSSLSSQTMQVQVRAGLSAQIQAPAAAAGLHAIALTAVASCELPQLTYEWTNVETGASLGQSSSVSLEPPSQTTQVQAFLQDPLTGNQITLTWTVLASSNLLLLDANGDGCNSLLDLYEVTEDWFVSPNSNYDANGDQRIDIRDLLYLNLDASQCAGKAVRGT